MTKNIFQNKFCGKSALAAGGIILSFASFALEHSVPDRMCQRERLGHVHYLCSASSVSQRTGNVVYYNKSNFT